MCRNAALLQWKQRTPFGTYHDLLKVCCAEGDSETASVICDIVREKVEDHGEGAVHISVVLAFACTFRNVYR